MQREAGGLQLSDAPRDERTTIPRVQREAGVLHLPGCSEEQGEQSVCPADLVEGCARPGSGADMLRSWSSRVWKHLGLLRGAVPARTWSGRRCLVSCIDRKARPEGAGVPCAGLGAARSVTRAPLVASSPHGPGGRHPPGSCPHLGCLPSAVPPACTSGRLPGPLLSLRGCGGLYCTFLRPDLLPPDQGFIRNLVQPPYSTIPLLT